MRGLYVFETVSNFTGEFIIFFLTEGSPPGPYVKIESFCKVSVENNKGTIVEIHTTYHLLHYKNKVFVIDILDEGRPDDSDVDVYVTNSDLGTRYCGDENLIKIYLEAIKSHKHIINLSDMV